MSSELFDFANLSTSLYPAEMPIAPLAEYIRTTNHRAGLGTESEAPSLNVKIDVWEGNGKRRILALIRSVLAKHPILNRRTIVVNVIHARRLIDPYNIPDDEFHIYVWTGVNSTTEEIPNHIRPPQSAWGISISCRDRAYPSSGKGIEIIDETTKYVVAEVFSNCLVIHHDIVHEGTVSEAKLFRILLERTAGLIGFSEEDIRKMNELEEQEQSARFLNVAAKIYHQRVSQAQEEFNAVQQDIDRNRKLLVEKSRSIIRLRDKVASLKNSKESIDAHLTEEFQRLQQHPQVIKLRIVNNRLNVFTDTIYCVHPRSKETHIIGKFRLSIDLVGTEDVQFFNLTHLINGYNDGMHAPHVFPNGNACWGSLVDSIPQYIASGDISIVVQLVIQFLEHVNLDDAAGKHIERWPVVSLTDQSSPKT